MPAPVVVYTDFESVIDDKNRHKSIMLFCLDVPAFRPLICSCEYFIHHTKKRAIFFLSWTIWFNCKECEEIPLPWIPIENTPEINREYRSTIVCPLCHRKLDNGEIAEIFEGDSLDASPRWDIMHMWQVYTPQGMERYVTSKPGSTSAPVVPSAISNSR